MTQFSRHFLQEPARCLHTGLGVLPLYSLIPFLSTPGTASVSPDLNTAQLRQWQTVNLKSPQTYGICSDWGALG